MVSDSAKDSSLLSDFAKKKKANWSWRMRMKQWKHDARHRQWIFHLKKGRVGKEENGGTIRSLSEKELDDAFEYLQIARIEEEIDDALSEQNIESDADSSASSSPTSVLTGNGPSSKISDCFCCSEKIVEEEEEVYGDALDNFEGFSDALNYFENENKNPSPETTNAEEESPKTTQRNCSADTAIDGEESPSLETKKAEQESPKKALDDKKTPTGEIKNSEQDASNTEPLPCPICYEDMDVTDLSFLPCPCGFKLCLFCHKKIVDNDGRCPNCRKEYQRRDDSGEVSVQQRGGGTLRLSPSFRGLDRA